MESRSVKQLLPEGKGEEQVKEADEVKLDVVEDIDKVEMEGEHDAGARMNTGYRSLEHDHVYEYGKGEERVKEADDMKLDVVEDMDKVEMEGEHDAGARMNTGCRSPEHDRVYENEEPVDSSTHAESSTTQTRGTIDKGEEHHETPGTTRESPLEKGHDQDGKGKEKVNESNVEQINIARANGKGQEKVNESNVKQINIARANGKGKEKVNESNMEQINIARANDKGEKLHETLRMIRESLSEKGHDQDNTKGKEKVIEANMVQIIIARDKGQGKEKVNEANVVQKIIVRDNDNGEEHAETETTRESLPENDHDQDSDNGEEHAETETTRDSLSENGHDQDNSKGKEKVNKAIVVQIIINRENEAQTLDAPPYAESSTAAERRLAEGKGEIQEEPQEGDGMTPESQNQEQDPIFNGACSLVKNVKEKCFIHRVHSGLRAGRDKHYKPVLVSIGPYHHGKPPVQDMEKYKIHYTEVLLSRVKEKNIDRYKKALEDEGEPGALDCYRDTHKMRTDSFATSMVYDGCFMIELFRRNMSSEKDDDARDILFNIRWMKPRLERDMLLFENQIPLLVLRALFSLTEQTTEEGPFVPLVLYFFEFNGKPILRYDVNLTNRLDDIPHLLGLVYEALVSRIYSAPARPPGKLSVMWTSLKSFPWTVFVRLIETTFMMKTAQQLNKERKSCQFIRTAVALEQVGVTFNRVEDYRVTFHDIKFSSGVLSIPRLVIDDNTESLFRNLVAYEQYSVRKRLHRVVDYLHVMDCLINTAKDVEVLRHCGIIDNRIGDDKKVSTMFNRLCSGVYFNQDEFFHKQMFDLVNEYCMDRTNAWKATLKNKYFGSPWSIMSFVAAVLLLLFTATQTVYSVLSYYNRSSS